MARPVLVLITGDPRTSPRPAEALRIALGLAANDLPVTVALTGPAVRLLDPEPEALVDGDEVARYREQLGRLGVAVRAAESGVASLAADAAHCLVF